MSIKVKQRHATDDTSGKVADLNLTILINALAGNG
jgi:hypothetical protein